ncbi:hypothetical protein [Pedobacter steynii]
MSYSGHQGASLTHGNDYLTFQALMQQERKKPATVEQAILFEDVIQPILQKNVCNAIAMENKKASCRLNL